MRLQEAYGKSRFHHFPVNERFLRYYEEEFRVFCYRRVKFYPEFVTEDGSKWRAIRVMLNTDDHWRILFPFDRDRSHTDGTVSAHHIALHCDASEPLSDEQIEKAGRVFYSVFETAREDFRHHRSEA